MTNIEIEDISSVKKKLTFEIPEQEVADVVDAQYRDLKRNTQIKGFRKGKVPLNILKTYFKGKVEAEAAQKMIEETFQPGLDERKINPIAVISINPEAVEVGKSFKYTAEIEVPPPIEVKDYKGLKLKKYVREVTDEMVGERIDHLRSHSASLVPIPETRGLQAGDHVVADMKAEAEGKAIPALTVEGYNMEMGRNFYLPDFDTKLEGMKPGETRQITMDLPETFPRKDLAGKAVTIDVSIHEAKVQVLPELDDDFAKDLGEEYNSLEDLREQIRTDLRQSFEEQATRELRNQIIGDLIESNEFDVPEAMTENQVDEMLNESLQKLAFQGIDLSRLPAPTPAQREQMKPAAVRMVKAALLLKAIGEQEGIEVSDEEREEGIKARAERLGLSVDPFKDLLEERKLADEFRLSLLTDKVYRLIEEHAEITEEEPPKTEKTPETESKDE